MNLSTRLFSKMHHVSTTNTEIIKALKPDFKSAVNKTGGNVAVALGLLYHF